MYSCIHKDTVFVDRFMIEKMHLMGLGENSKWGFAVRWAEAQRSQDEVSTRLIPETSGNIKHIPH